MVLRFDDERRRAVRLLLFRLVRRTGFRFAVLRRADLRVAFRFLAGINTTSSPNLKDYALIYIHCNEKKFFLL